jgi:hypothetical protein
VNNELERMWKETVMVLHWRLSGGTDINFEVSDLREGRRTMSQQSYPLEYYVSFDTGVGR